jgi:hypothetical protein
MLYIDPNLHNPKINNIPLLVNNRINPRIAISKEDIIGGNGVVIDKYPDGTIMISANTSNVVVSDGDKYTNVWDIDFMSELPSVLFKYLNPLFDAAEVELFFIRDFSAISAKVDLQPSDIYKEKSDGSKKEYNDIDYVDLDYSVSAVVNNDAVEFSCEFNNNNIGHAYYLYIRSANDEQIISKGFAEESCTVWMSRFPSGTYTWEVCAFNIYSMDIYTKKTGKFYLENNATYLKIATPQNMSTNEDNNWLLDSSSVYEGNGAHIAFNTSSVNDKKQFHTNTSPTPHWISWKYKHGKVLIGKIEITSGAFNTSHNNALTEMSFEGSDDGVNWTKIDVLKASYPNVATTRKFILNNNRAFQWHRLVSLTSHSYMTISFIKATKE